MIRTFKEAEKYIYSHIESDPKKRFSGEFGLRRAAYLLKLIGNPQNKLKIIHVAGTSGKGSTSFYISQLLRSHNLKVSLTISPHLLDIRERIQINNKLISKKEFISALNYVIPSIIKMKKSEFYAPSYFEILIAMFFAVSVNQKVDYAVVETGLGGTYDGTNTVSRSDKLCVITKIGFDHTEILGNSLVQIAKQKSGIIKQGNDIISCSQQKQVETILIRRANLNRSKILFIRNKINIDPPKIIDGKVNFDYSGNKIKLKNILLNTGGIFQSVNSSLAIAALEYFSVRDSFTLNNEKILQTLKTVNFPGRMENFTIGTKRLTIDGAHNPQKMKSFTESLKISANNKSTFLIAFRSGKDYEGMLSYIIPMASKIIVTGFKINNMDIVHYSQDENDVKNSLFKKGFRNVEIIKSAKEALSKLIQEKNNNLVVTGSLYLLSSLYSDIKKISD